MTKKDDYDHIAESMMQGINFFLPGFDGTKEEGLRLIFASGYDTLKSYGSLLGISYYLEKVEWEKLIRFVAGVMPAGSAICFDFPSTDESKETKVNKTLACGAGEQMKAQYPFAEMEGILSECGFKVTEHLGAEDMTERYFADYNRSTPEHPMAAPVGVDYVFAVRE